MAAALRIPTLALALALAVTPALGGAGVATGLGAIGDSYTDEYRFYPPDRSTARSWVEVLVESTDLDFGAFDPNDRGTPQHAGYAHNWARSGATSTDAVAEGQHLGLAGQIARGEVGLAFVFIGGNDFLDALADPDPLAALADAEPAAIANLREIVAALLDASPDARVVLATVPEMTCLPEVKARAAAGTIDPAALAEAIAAVGRFNDEVRALAGSAPRLALADLEREARLADRLLPAVVRLPGLDIDFETAGNDPGRFFLADGRHLGTFGQGLIAQRMIQAANRRFGLELPSPSFAEILDVARAAAGADE